MTLLLSLTIKTALLLLAALAAAATLRRRSAAARHWVLTAALVCSFILPVVELLVPAWSIPLPAAWSASSANSSIGLTSAPPAAPAAGRANAADAAPPSAGGTLPELESMLGATWIAGALVGLAVLAAGLWRLRALAAHAEQVSSGPWREAADVVSQRYALRSAVRLLYCRHPTMLATWGVRAPAILLPVGAHGWREDRIEAVLHHELAHVVRRDWVVALLAHVLRAVYWFNPLVWIACRRLRHEAERACDDLVLVSGISGAEFATHLLDVARESVLRGHPWSPAIAVAHRSMLEGRVRAMLNSRVNREPPTVFARAATVAALAVLTMSIGVVTVSETAAVAAATDVRPLALSSPPVLPAISQAQPGETRLAREATPPAQGQAQAQAAGTIEGVLYDPFGGLLPGASVRLTAVGIGGSQTALTDRNGSFAFKGLGPGDYELLTDLPGFTTVKNVLRAEPGATVRRHITLPIGTVQETIHATCASTDLSPSRPTAPTASTTPGAAQRPATGPRGTEPKIPSTFTGGIGGQIKVPTKLSHTNPVCPAGVPAESTVVRLAGRIGIDGLFTDLHDVGGEAQPAYVASALEAARQWVFTPTFLNGAPIEANITVTVSYTWSN